MRAIAHTSLNLTLAGDFVFFDTMY